MRARYYRYDGGLQDMLQLHLVVLAWGFTGVLGKLISLPAVEVVIWRTALASGGLAVLAWWLRAPLRLPFTTAARLVAVGMLVGLHWFLFFLSARVGNVSMCMAAMPTTMLWCTLLEPLANRGKRISRLELTMGAIMLGAVWLIYRVEFTHWLGFTIGLGSAMAGAMFAVLNKRLVTQHHFAVISCYQMMGASLAGLIGLPFVSTYTGALFHAPTAADIGWLLVLSMACTVGAYGAYMDVLQRVSVFTINVFYNLEPVYGIILAALIFGDRERMSGGFYLGAGIIITAVVTLPIWQRLRQRVSSGA